MIMQSAVDLARRGFRVFPILPNRKSPPAFEGWQALATTEPQRVEAWWGRQYRDHNIGLATGRGVLVLDFDVAKGGLESLALMDALGLPIGMMRVRTPSGGVHVYLRVEDAAGITVSVDRLEGFPGTDVRCDGGYVLAPGSVIDGVEYMEIER